MEETCTRVGEVLQQRSVSRDALRDAAQTLESLSYDLASAVIESIATHGDSREMQMARAAVQAMDERLTWVQRHRVDARPTEVWGELESAWQSVRDALRLLGSLAASRAARGRSDFSEVSPP